MKKIHVGFLICFIYLCSMGIGLAESVQALTTEQIIEDLVTSKTGKEYRVKKILYERNRMNIVNYFKRKINKRQKYLYIVVELSMEKDK